MWYSRHKAQGTGHKGTRIQRYKLLVLWCSGVLVFWCACAPQPYKQTQSLMDTLGEITVFEKNAQKAQNSIAGAFSEMRRIEGLLSVFKPQSEISKLNQTGRTLLSPETANLIKRSLKISRLTKGAFDISIYPAEEKWGFYQQQYKIPSPKELKEEKELINYKNIIVRGTTVFFKVPGMKIDLGGIAKGYAVDKAIEVLKARGITNALVNLGGDIYVLGKKRNQPWKIGLQHPRQRDKMLTVLKLEDKAIATSGDYERFFKKSGQRYAHILNPSLGKPATKCMAVTVIADDATTADALATGIFVLGKYEGLKLAESLPDIEVIIVDKEGKIFTSSGIKDLKTF